MSLSQLPNSPKFRGSQHQIEFVVVVCLSTGSSWDAEAELLLLLLLPLSCSPGNGNAAATLTASHTHSITPQNTAAPLAFPPSGKDPTEPGASPAPQSVRGCYSPALPAAQIHKDPSREHRAVKSFADLWGPRLCPAVFLSLWLFTYFAPSSQAPCLIAVLYPSSESPPSPVLPQALHRSRFSRALHPHEKQRLHPPCSRG